MSECGICFREHDKGLAPTELRLWHFEAPPYEGEAIKHHYEEICETCNYLLLDTVIGIQRRL